MFKTKTKKPGFWANLKEIIVLLLVVFLIRTFGFGLYQVPTGSMETTMLVGERFFADKLTPLFSSIKNEEIIAFNDPTWTYSNNNLVRLFQEYVWGPSNWTKRVIGIPGDTVRGVIEDGKPVVYLNRKKLNEPYLNQYPLISLWKIDPREVALRVRRGDISQVERFIGTKSFDVNLSYDKQKFYRVRQDRILKDGDNPIFIYPRTPIMPAAGFVKPKGDENFWSGSDVFNVKLGKNQYWIMGDNRLGSTDSRWFGPIDGRLIHSRILFRIWSIDTDEAWWIWDLIKNPIGFWKRVRWNRIFGKVR